MKTLLSLVLLLPLHAALAQTVSTAPSVPTASASPAASASPVKRPPVAVNSLTPKTPPNAPESRGAGWERRALADIASSKEQTASVNLIFDGDSITDGWQQGGLAVWNERFAKYHPIDFGISGDVTQSILWRLAHGQAEGMHPKLIALMIGTNNMKFTSTPEEIAGGVKEIIAEYQKRCPDAVILLQAIFPRAQEPTDPYRLKVKATNEFLAKLGDGSKVIYLDFGDKFLSPDGKLGKELFPDGLHPNAKGYRIWADAIQPVLDRYLGAS